MWKGVLTALVTPIKNDNVDEEALRNLVEFQIENEVNGLVPCGTTGEAATLSKDEKIKVIKIVIDQAKGRVPVIAGTGSNNTQTTIEFTKKVKKLNADGALIVTPYYNKPTQEGLFLHYQAIAKKTKFPICLYNVPGRTSVNLLPKTVERLSEISYIKCIKEASGNLNQVTEVISLTTEKMTVLSGDDALTLPILSIGGHGVISVVSNIAPKLIAELYNSFAEEDIAKATAVHHQLFPLIEAIFIETNPLPVKTALSMMGMMKEEFRLPLCEMSESNKEKLKQVVKKLGII